MARGGYRTGAGRKPDPNSARSEARGLVFERLPAEGYQGPIPSFPLPNHTPREAEVWRWAWRTPQADAWARESWRLLTIALWARTYVVCEGSEAKSADRSSLHRFADQIGLTPSGLRENRWTIAPTPVEPKPTAGDELAPRRRLRS